MIGVVKEHKIFVLILVLFSFFIRGQVFKNYLSKNNNFWQVDSNTYHLIATQIAQKKGVSIADGKPSFYRLPGYPIFLAVWYKIFGVNKHIALWAQVLLASLIPLLIFFLALTLFPHRLLVAQIASLYSCIHLGFVLYSGFFMTEALFLLFFLLFAILFFSALYNYVCKKSVATLVHERKMECCETVPFVPYPVESGPSFIEFFEKTYGEDFPEKHYWCMKNQEVRKEQRSYQNLFLAGLVLGFASLVRPVGHYLIIISILLLWTSRELWQEKACKSITIFTAWLFPVSFWLVRNYLLLGYLFFHTLPGGHFMYFSAARVAMHVHNTSYEKAKDILTDEFYSLQRKRERQEKRDLNEIELCYLRERVAVKYFINYPLLTVKNWLTDIFRTCFSLYSAELLFLESGRKEVKYFKKGRGIPAMLRHYLDPPTKNNFLKGIIFSEIFLYLVILLGFLGYVITSFANINRLLCPLLLSLPFMALFIVISLAGGYARMRLPVEPFLIIFSAVFYLRLFQKKKVSSE